MLFQSKHAAAVLLILLMIGVSGMFSALAAAQPPLSGSVSPTQGLPGTRFHFSAAGFDAGSDVAYWITMPNGEVIGDSEDFLLVAASDGAIAWTWTAPTDATPGVWSMVAQQIDRPLHVAQIVFEIVPPGQPTPPPPDESPPERPLPDTPSPDTPPPGSGTQITISPSVGTPDTTFTIVASGFNPGERVGYWFNAPDGTVVGDAEEYRLFASDDGVVEVAWVPSYRAVPGVWSVVVRGVESKTERSTSFEIRV
jgi:hypothetical protein